MTKCPNKNNKDWKLMVSLFGEENALYLYDAFEDIPSLQDIAIVYKQNYKKDIPAEYLEDYRTPTKILRNESVKDKAEYSISTDIAFDDDGRPVITPSKKSSRISDPMIGVEVLGLTADHYIKVLEDKYPGTKFNKVPTRVDGTTKFYMVLKSTLNDTPNIREGNEYEANGVIYGSYEDAQKALNNEAVYQLGPIELQRQSSTNLETRERYEAKKKMLLANFPRVKEIIEDENLPVLGQIEQNGSIIRVNPTLMKSDTIGHEFGHLLLVLLGGMNSPLVRRAYKLLQGTDLYNRVREEYSDQPESVIVLEVVAQAIGEESVDFEGLQEEINKDEAKATWYKILLKIYEKLKDLLGIEKDAVRRLTKLMYKGIPDTGVSFNEVYEQRNSREAKSTDKLPRAKPATLPEYIKNLEQVMSKEEALVEAAKDILNRKIIIYQNRADRTSVNKFKKALQSMEEASTVMRGLMNFTRVAAKQTDELYNNSFLPAKKAYLAGDTEAVNAKQLTNWFNYISAFDILESIKLALIERIGMDNFSRDYTNLNNMLNEAIDMKNDIKKFYVEAGMKVLVDKLMGESTRVYAEYKLYYERKWRELSKEEQTKTPLEEYIKQNVEAEKANIEEKSRLTLLGELDKAQDDISWVSRWAETILDSDDMIVGTMTKVVAKAIDDARIEQLGYRDELVDLLRELEQVQNNNILTDIADFYDFFIEKDEKGNRTNNYVYKLRGTFFEDYKAYSDFLDTDEGEKTIDDRYDSLYQTQKHFTRDQVKGLLKYEWKEANAPLDRPAYTEAFENYLLTLLDKGTITAVELEMIRFNQRSRSKEDWFELLEGNEEAALNVMDWINQNVWLYRNPIKKYSNPQWEALQKMRKAGLKGNVQTDPRIKFYDFVVEQNARADRWVPQQYRLYTRLPGIAKDLSERIKSGENISGNVVESISRVFNKKPDDTEQGEMDGKRVVEIQDELGRTKMFLPVHYSVRLTPEEQSYDIASIYYNRFKSASDYKNRNNILPEVELATYLIENRQVIKRDSGGNPITNINSKLANREMTKTGVSAMLTAQWKDWLEAVFYGKRKADEGTIKLFGKEVDYAKTLDFVTELTAMNLLGLNVIQGVANVALGETMQQIEAFAGEHYDMKNYTKASLKYDRNIFGMMGDIGSRKPKNLISILVERVDLLHDFSSPENFKKSTKFRQLMSRDTLFFQAHIGEHMMQTRLLLAVLDHMKAVNDKGQAIKNKQGKELSVLDVLVLDKDGKITTKAGAVFTEKDLQRAGHHAKRLLSRIHGEYSDLGRVAMQKYAIMRMVYLFRKFVYQGYKRRWESSSKTDPNGNILYKYNELGENFTEGAYISFGRYMGRLMKDLFKYRSFELAGKEYSKMTSLEQANIKRTVGELVALTSLFAVSTLLISAMKEDDDDDLLQAHLVYQILRMKSEMAFYINPMEAWRILKSPMASMSLFENFIRLFNLLFNPFDLMSPGDRFQSGPWKGRPKYEKYLINMFPVARQWPRITNAESLAQYFSTTR